MRPASSLRIQEAVAIDDLVVFVLQQREIVLARRSRLKLADEFTAVLRGIDADRQDFRVFLAENVFQLAELLRAIGSPVTAIKDQHDVLLAPVVGK
jgi:hypothetical protein